MSYLDDSPYILVRMSHFDDYRAFPLVCLRQMPREFEAASIQSDRGYTVWSLGTVSINTPKDIIIFEHNTSQQS